MKKNNSTLTLLINLMVVVLVSCNLRAPITAVGPVLNQIIESLRLDSFQGSMLTSIPLVMFACCSVMVSRFLHHIGILKFLLYSMVILSIGLLMRVSGATSPLFVGSILIGLGICIGNVVIPGYIKNKFPKQIGLMTGVFAIAMNLTAALASGCSVSIGQFTGYGWKASLGVWVVIAFLALVVLIIEFYVEKRKAKTVEEDIVIVSKRDMALFKSGQAWAISIFMGIQSLVFYSLITWLPSVFVDYGLTPDQTGWVLFVIQISMLPITFVGPIIAHKMTDQRLLIPFISLLMLISILMFAWLKADFVYVAAVLLGISNGLSFSLSILFFSLKTKSSFTAIRVSGMAQSVGYFIAAIGPSIFGKLHDFDGSWDSSFYFICGSIVLMFYFGLKAAKQSFIDD